MASPSVVNRNTTTDTAGGTTHAVNLPASLVSGNLLLLFINIMGATITTPAGWTQLYKTADAGSGLSACYYKTSNGTEGATVTVTTASSKAVAVTYQVSGWSGTPEAGTAVTGSSANPDPPNLAPSWGSADQLFIAVEHHDSSNATTGFSTSYSNGQTANTTGAASVGIGTCERQLTAASDNPSAFTVGGSGQWLAQTIAVKPAGGAPFVNTWPSLIVPAPTFPVQARPAFVGSFPAVPPQASPTWPPPIAAYWKAQDPYSQPSPGTLLPPFIPSSQPMPRAYPPPFNVPATPAFVGQFPAVAPQIPPTWPPPQDYPARPYAVQARPAFVGQFPTVPPLRPFIWPAPQTFPWQPQQQAAQPFLGLSVIIQAPFKPYPWPTPPAGLFRPQPQQAWFNPTGATPFTPFAWPRPIEAQWRPQAPQAWFNPSSPFRPYQWPAPLVTAFRQQASAPWFNPTAVAIICPPIMSTSFSVGADLASSALSSDKMVGSVVRSASMSSGVVQGSAKFAPTISGQAKLNSSRKKC